MNADLRALFKPKVIAPEIPAPVTFRGRLMGLWRTKSFSPTGLIRRALFVLLFFGLAHVFGLKEFTSVLNGTTGSVAVGWTASVLLGATYVLLYLGFILLVPILLLGAALLAVWNRVSQPSKS